MICHVMLTVEPLHGATLQECAAACREIAQRVGTTVKMEYEGVTLIAHPERSVTDILQHYQFAKEIKDREEG